MSSISKPLFFQVDAFSHIPFKGNPAGVFISSQSLDEKLMQNIAMEMNLSETSFVVPIKNQDYSLRWFTPTTEVKLCGHATLAAAHVLYESSIVSRSATINFHTLSGVLRAKTEASSIVLDFPKRSLRKINVLEGLENALSVSVKEIYRSEEDDLLIQLHDENSVRSVSPDFNALKIIDARGIIITAASDHSEIDFVSRFFAPRVGVLEDPVTGSAHCALFPYWGALLQKKVMRAFQASQRGGHIDGEVFENRVLLKGQAISVFELKCMPIF